MWHRAASLAPRRLLRVKMPKLFSETWALTPPMWGWSM